MIWSSGTLPSSATEFAVRFFAQQDSDAASIDTVVEPDVSVICDRDKLDGQGCKGAPATEIKTRPNRGGLRAI